METTGQDCSLIRAAQGGNHAAFEQLVHAHDQAVLRLAFRITGSRSDAQDIHQETFLKAYRKLGNFRFECAFSTWIYRIATNVCLDHLRRNRARAEGNALELNVDNFLNQVSDDRPVSNPERQLLRLELGFHIARALRKLTPRERLLFELKHFQGLKLRTVGEILNCSESAVKISLFRATKKLRLHLERYAKGIAKQRSDQDPSQTAILPRTRNLRRSDTLASTASLPMRERRSAAGAVSLYGDKASSPFVSSALRFTAKAVAISILLLTSTYAFASALDNSPTALAILQAKADQVHAVDRCFLYAELVSRMTDIAGQQFEAGNSAQASETLKLVERYVEKIHTVIADDRKKQKNAELLIRRTSFRLKDLLGEAAYEDRPALQTTLNQLNQVQSELMVRVFER